MILLRTIFPSKEDGINILFQRALDIMILECMAAIASCPSVIQATVCSQDLSDRFDWQLRIVQFWDEQRRSAEIRSDGCSRTELNSFHAKEVRMQLLEVIHWY